MQQADIPSTTFTMFLPTEQAATQLATALAAEGCSQLPTSTIGSVRPPTLLITCMSHTCAPLHSSPPACPTQEHSVQPHHSNEKVYSSAPRAAVQIMDAAIVPGAAGSDAFDTPVQYTFRTGEGPMTLRVAMPDDFLVVETIDPAMPDAVADVALGAPAGLDTPVCGGRGMVHMVDDVIMPPSLVSEVQDAAEGAATGECPLAAQAAEAEPAAGDAEDADDYVPLEEALVTGVDIDLESPSATASNQVEATLLATATDADGGTIDIDETIILGVDAELTETEGGGKGGPPTNVEVRAPPCARFTCMTAHCASLLSVTMPARRERANWRAALGAGQRGRVCGADGGVRDCERERAGDRCGGHRARGGGHHAWQGPHRHEVRAVRGQARRQVGRVRRQARRRQGRRGGVPVRVQEGAAVREEERLLRGVHDAQGGADVPGGARLGRHDPEVPHGQRQGGAGVGVARGLREVTWPGRCCGHPIFLRVTTIDGDCVTPGERGRRLPRQ